MLAMSEKETKHKGGKEESKQFKYFICERCGYISIVRNSSCPICAKDNIEIKLINVFDYEN
jgi:rubrerythrin